MICRTIICCAYPFGYGPAAKLLHIARVLKTKDVRLVFLGTGIAHELVARSRLFDEVVNTPPTDQRSSARIRDGAAVLSIMDRDYCTIAVEYGRPVFVVDSLLWMRDRVPPVFQQARRYWAQNFADDRGRLTEIGPNATVVGPILGPKAIQSQPGTRVVINLGGGETPEGVIDAHSAYFDFVLQALQRALLLRHYRGVVLLGGERSIAYLRRRYPDCGLEMASASHDQMPTLLRSARWVATSPGLTTTLECFQAGVPTFFLPPQNYSQWWILKKLRERGLAPDSFHWEDLLPDYPVTERMAEAARGPLVREAIHRLAGDRRAQQRLETGLADALGNTAGALVARQRAFFDSLGPVATEKIVNELMANIDVAANAKPQTE